MKRFYFGEEEGDEEDEEEDYDDNDESKIDFFQMTHFPLESEGGLMECAIKICQSSIFWLFYSIEYKLNKIKEVYKSLQDIVDEENDRI